MRMSERRGEEERERERGRRCHGDQLASFCGGGEEEELQSYRGDDLTI